MTKILHKRFQLQLLFALVAAIAVVALTVGLILNAIQHAESFVLADTTRSLNHAIQELDTEYRLRLHSGDSWKALPSAAQDLTLSAISRTVLESYPGVEGGFWENSQFLGYSYPTHDGDSPKIDVPPAERPAIEEVIAISRHQGKDIRVIRGRHDLVVISATFTGATASWAMKRLSGQAEPAQRTRNILLVVLVGVALLGAAGVLATGIGLRRGVAQIKTGLAALDHDFGFNLPEPRDELGEIGAAINRMARTRQRLEAEVRREDRARAMGHLIGRIAHEMRNPLNSIRLSLQVLAQREQEHRLKPNDFQIVTDEVDRMNRLLSDLLTFQQPRPPKVEPCEIVPVLQQCLDLVMPQAEKLGVKMTVGFAAAQPLLLDEQYLRQIVLNLLLNAIEASAAGGRVTVSTASSNGGLTVQVCDNGPGLTFEQQEHLFEPFYTTKANGHGLGLAVSRELAQSMGGELAYQNGQGSGAHFVLHLKGTNAD